MPTDRPDIEGMREKWARPISSPQVVALCDYALAVEQERDELVVDLKIAAEDIVTIKELSINLDGSARNRFMDHFDPKCQMGFGYDDVPRLFRWVEEQFKERDSLQGRMELHQESQGFHVEALAALRKKVVSTLRWTYDVNEHCAVCQTTIQGSGVHAPDGALAALLKECSDAD